MQVQTEQYAAKPLSTTAHGAIDYAYSALLAALPEMLECSPQAATLLRAAAGGALAYSLLTDYELGVAPLLSMRRHFALDFAAAALLGSAPLWLDDSPRVKATFAGLALLAVVVTLNTQPEPYR